MLLLFFFGNEQEAVLVAGQVVVAEEKQKKKTEKDIAYKVYYVGSFCGIFRELDVTEERGATSGTGGTLKDRS